MELDRHYEVAWRLVIASKLCLDRTTIPKVLNKHRGTDCMWDSTHQAIGGIIP